MTENNKANFIKRNKPGKQSQAELKNGRYFDTGTRIMLHTVHEWDTGYQQLRPRGGS